MQRQVRVGVIGLGVGERHVAGYQTVPSCTVEAVCDIDPTRAAEVADRWGVPRRSTDYRAITEAGDIDAVSICSYDDVHAEQALSALRNGKHVMVEKPVVLFRADAERLVAAQQESGLILTSNLILRASPRFQELHHRIRRGDLGEIFYAEGDYLHQILWKLTEGWRGRMSTYSVVYGGGIHLIDLLRWLLGDEITEVSGMGTNILTRGSSYPFDDTTVNLLRFAGGAIAKTTTSLGPQRTKFHGLELYGTKGTFINDMPAAKLFTGDAPGDERPVDWPYPGAEKGDHLPAFVAAVRGEGEPSVSSVDVFRVMDVCFAAVDAIREGRTVTVSYLV